jgi:excinuclease ABC subunit A
MGGYDFIKIRGARVHNLKNIDVDIPKNKFVVITGLSGSGKSSLAFDTIYAEGQRRYVESLSAYARQFLGVMQKPDVDKIEGISPAISIDQRKWSHNPRSTVGTMTEIYDYLRLLFARAGLPHCPKCGKEIRRQTVDQITNSILRLPKFSTIVVLGPVIRGKKGEHRGVLEEIMRAGFNKVRVDGIIYEIQEVFDKSLDRYKNHNIEVVVDRLVLDDNLERSRLVDAIEMALKLGKGVLFVSYYQKNDSDNKDRFKTKDIVFSEHFACEECNISIPELEPRYFSFNNPYGACDSCQGLGEKLEVSPELVIPNKNLSIAEGAIFPWARASHKVGRQGYFWWQLEELSKKRNINLYSPVKNLSKEDLDIIFYGGEGFVGVIPWLEKRYHETDSEYTREEIEKYMVQKKCEKCKGKRLKEEFLAVTFYGKSISDLVEMQIDKLKNFFATLAYKGNLENNVVIRPLVKEIISRLEFLVDVGLDYLTLDRKVETLSGGEEQRIRLATQLGSRLTGVLYILDEPSIGLHARDQDRLIKTIKGLRDLGNSVITVEHDPETIKTADWVIDIGPGAGKEGGRIVFSGTPKELLKSKTLTGEYLSGRKQIDFTVFNKDKKDNKNQKWLIVKGAKEHNLKNITVKIPLGKFVCITGVSGSGKSSLMNDIIAKALLKKFYNSKQEVGLYDEIIGWENLDKVVVVDQSPIGRNPRSNPATYTGVFSFIRDIFSKTREAKIRGYKPGRFSFNVKGGRCEACEGQGVRKIEMFFLPDIYQECQECKGKRFNEETLSIEYKGKNIAEVLSMTVKEAMEFFKNIPSIFSKLKTLYDVGLGYIELGQPATSLSGGEAQRIKLATELSRKGTGRSLYILDEPTTGLHLEDIRKLIFVLKSLTSKGNTVLVTEHQLDFIKCADWIIDLGPEGGEKGGYIVAEGVLEDIIKSKKSYTGKYLNLLMKNRK